MKRDADSLENMIQNCRERPENLSLWVEKVYDQINRWDPIVHAMTHIIPQSAALSQTAGHSPFAFPFVVKDNLLALETLTTCASRMLSEYRSPYDATVVQRLRSKGGILVGKTNLDEFAIGSTTEASSFFPTKNPLDLERVAGGSSGGSAAAVACGMAPLALGSDTGGSIRIPAAFCGVVGFKPSYGMVSRYGLVSYCASMDQIGPICLSVRDAALAGSWLFGIDPKDSTSLSFHEDLLEKIEHPLRGLRLCALKTAPYKGVGYGIKKAYQNAMRIFRKAGATVTEEVFPLLKSSSRIYAILTAVEAATNLARFDSGRFCAALSRSEGFGSQVKTKIMLGNLFLSEPGYRKRLHAARCMRYAISQFFKDLFRRYDGMICPTTPMLAPLLGERSPLDREELDVFTIPANLAGLPAISVPMGNWKGLPMGLQIVSGFARDAKLLRIARGFEKAYEREHP